MKKLLFYILFSGFFYQLPIFSQSCSTLNINHQVDIASMTCPPYTPMVMTMIHDQNNLPYLYVATKAGGLKIYDINVIPTPVLVATVPVSMYDSLDVMSLSQTGNYLYLALGNSFAADQKSGMAIVDVTSPTSPMVTDFWVLPSSLGGSGIIKAEGNYAYLGAMINGLIILDISNKSNIQFVSQFIPDFNYPPIASPDTTKINARGMEVKNSIVYLCYDAGGFRIINCTNKLAPVETGQYCNPATYIPFNRPRAYNNVVIDDTLAYIAVDYCGMEVLNISDTSNITILGWWNPYNCPNSNWFSSPSHTNEIQFDKTCGHVFLSTGKSDMIVIDVSNPAQPDSCNFYGGVSNNIGTWGVGLWQNQIYLSYICTLGIPFSSNWTGVKILTYTPCSTGIDEHDTDGINIFPIPASDKITIELKSDFIFSDFSITNTLGQTFHLSFKTSANKVEVNVSELNSGFYFLKLSEGGKEITKKFVKE